MKKPLFDSLARSATGAELIKLQFHNQATPDRQEPGHTDNGTRTQAHRASNGTGTGSHTPLTTQDPNPQTATQPAAVRPTLAGAAWKAKKS